MSMIARLKVGKGLWRVLQQTYSLLGRWEEQKENGKNHACCSWLGNNYHFLSRSTLLYFTFTLLLL